MTHQEARAVWKHATRNRQELEQSSKCGCFSCLRIYEPSALEGNEWTDDEQTAICPFCGVDSVIGSASGYSIDVAFLQALKDVFF